MDRRSGAQDTTRAAVKDPAARKAALLSAVILGLFVLIPGLLSAWGCGGPDDSGSDSGGCSTAPPVPDTIPPRVTSVGMAHSWAGTSRPLEVYFSEHIQPSSYGPGTIQVFDLEGREVPGVVGDVNFRPDAISFTARPMLAYLASYRGVVAAGVRDEAGNPLEAPYEFTFATGPQGFGRWLPHPWPRFQVMLGEDWHIFSTDQGLLLYGHLYGSDDQKAFLFRPGASDWEAISVGGVTRDRRFAEHTALWTGAELLTWGGRASYSGTFLSTGVAFDPATGVQRALSNAGAPQGRFGLSSVWTGKEMIIWGGDESTPLGTVVPCGRRYDPAADAWSPVSTAGAPSPRVYHSAVWTGSRMLVWGGMHTWYYGSYLADGAAYSPSTNSWTPLSTAGAPLGRLSHLAAWADSRMIVWGGSFSDGTVHDEVSIYDPAADSWTSISATGSPKGRYHAQSAWTGSELLVWGGRGNYLDDCTYGGRFDPSLGTWRAMEVNGQPELSEYVKSAWTGSRFIALSLGWSSWFDGAQFVP